MIKKLKTNESVKYQKLTPEEMKARGILGRLVGVCADFINPTRNGRKYSEQLWENVFSNPIMQEKIKNGVCYGELGHPEDRTETDLEKIAICLREQPVKNDKGQLIAVFDILDTPCGRILKTLCDYGSKMGISSRGQGDLITDYNGDEAVDPDTYECECWDVVLVPGVETARLDYIKESLNKNNTLKRALRESLDNASDEEKKVMEDTLKDLNIEMGSELVEEKEEEEVEIEEVAVDDEEPEVESEEEATEDTAEIEVDEIEDEATEESIEEVEEDTETKEITVDDVLNFLQQHLKEKDVEKIADIIEKADLDTEEETSEEESVEIDDTNSEEEEVQEEETEVEADDAGEEDVLEQLKEALRAKSVAEANAKDLQEKLAVSDSKVNALEESAANYRDAIERLSKIAKDNRLEEGKVSELEEKVKEQDKTIEEQKQRLVRLVNARRAANEECDDLREKLNKRSQQVKTLNESVKSNSKVNEEEKTKLQESFNKQLEESKKENQSLKESLTKVTTIKESYKKLATQAANKYIEVKAQMLGLTAKDIKRKLGESYSLEDVDQVCEDLKEYQVNMNNLPFNTNSKLGVRVNEAKGSRSVNLARNKSVVDDDIDDSLIRLANL